MWVRVLDKDSLGIYWYTSSTDVWGGHPWEYVKITPRAADYYTPDGHRLFEKLDHGYGYANIDLDAAVGDTFNIEHQTYFINGDSVSFVRYYSLVDTEYVCKIPFIDVATCLVKDTLYIPHTWHYLETIVWPDTLYTVDRFLIPNFGLYTKFTSEAQGSNFTPQSNPAAEGISYYNINGVSFGKSFFDFEWRVGVKETLQSQPNNFTLMQNYPNPFNSSTVINFAIPTSAEIKLTVFDVTGKEVKTILNSRLLAGNHSAQWDGTDDFGRTVASGIYFVRLQVRPGESRSGGTGQYSKTIKAIYTR